MPSGRRRISSTRCSPVAAIGPGRIDTTIDAGLQRLVERQIQRYLQQHGDRGIRNASALARRHARHGGEGVGRLGRLLERGHRRAGQRRAGQAIAGLDAQAVRLRASARSGRAASADDPARPADVIRSLRAGEFRRPLFWPDHRGSGADSQPQHSRGVGGHAAEAAEPVPVPAERRHSRHETGILLRPRAAARRRRGDDGGARRSVRHARQSGRAAAASR